MSEREELTEGLLEALEGLTVVQQFSRVELPNLLTGNCYEIWDRVKVYRRAWTIAPTCDVEGCPGRAIAMYQDDQRRGYQLCVGHAPDAANIKVRNGAEHVDVLAGER